MTIADFAGANEHGVRFSRGDAGRALYVLADIGALIESGRFTPPDTLAFAFADVADAHRASEEGHGRAKIVLVVGAHSSAD